ncbi:MAG TPA: hypothetical protein VMS31_03230 [Pyrinomonadaceae bacterium]|nr:hypothetical protein [Pyrinomonadaceae bacterium]
MSQSVKEARRQQTQAEVKRLTKAVKSWFDRRVELDTDEKTKLYRAQYDSQLNAVFNEVNGAAGIIAADLDKLVLADTKLGDVYTRCAQTDRRLVWLWRVFNFFSEKFDQREDPKLGETLRAADEVVWSCYSPFFQNPTTAAKREPPPLPYIGTEYSPAAVRRDQTPGSLLKKGKDFDPLQRYLDRLPIPILQLPPNAVTAPWTLVLIGHEVGHFIQPLVQQDPSYLVTFSTALESAVARAKGDKKEQQRWKNWAPEVFADWYSVVCMGPWALWVMAQFEIQDEPTMLVERSSYPSPLARLALLAELTDRYLPTEGAKMFDDLGLKEMAARYPKARDLTFVKEVATAVVESLPDEGKLENLLSFRKVEFEAKGEVEKRAARLLAGNAGVIQKDLRMARLIAAGSARAWSEIMKLPDLADRQAAMDKLPQALTDMIACAPPGKRAAPKPARADQNPGNELAKALGEIVESETVEPSIPLD